MKLFLIIFLSVLVSCNPNNHSSRVISKHDYEEIVDIEIEYDQIFTIPFIEYYVYFYSKTCMHCHEIKNDVISFALDNKNKFYFVEPNDNSPHKFNINEINKTIGATAYDEVWVGVTPELAYIYEGRVIENIFGNDVKTYLNMIE